MEALRLLLLIAIISVCDGALRFAASYGDDMVLQRAPNRAVIWGFATNNNDTVTAKIVGHGSPVHAVVAQGMWKVKLPAMSNEGPFTITVSSPEGSISLNDVLFGDVWLCSGQSNMEYSFSQVNNSAYEITKSLSFHKIRIFHIRDTQSSTPLQDLKSVQTPWTTPTKHTVGPFSGLCLLYGEYIYSHRKYPIGLIQSDWGGTRIEVWSSPTAIAKCPAHAGKRGASGTSSLWNAMIKPLLGMTIYGAIWYQGESNAGQPDHYTCQFPAMISDWRKQFHHGSLGETSQHFPFGFVQLAGYRHNFVRVGGFPALRWSQTANIGHVPNHKLQHTFMAVAMDLPDFNSPRGPIHPRFKQDVGERLGLASLAVAYGEKGLAYQGPFPTSFNGKTVHQLTVEYEHGHTVLDVRSNDGFEICCSSTSNTQCGSHDSWVAAPILHHHGATITLNTSGCQAKHLVGLRYAWRESPCEFKKCAIYGRDNDLPAPPYIRNTSF